MDTDNSEDQPDNTLLTTPENSNSQDTPVLSSTPMSSGSGTKWHKKKSILVLGAIILLIGATASWLLIHKDSTENADVAQSRPNAIQQKKTASDQIVVVPDGQSVKIYNPLDNKLTEVYKSTAEETTKFCYETCFNRRVSLAADNSKIAFDHLVKNDKEAIGYYDFATKKSTVLVNGSNPWWSPDGTKLAYLDDSGGVSILTLSSGFIVTIDNSKSSFNKESGTTFPTVLIGWKSNNDIVFDERSIPDSPTFNIGNIETKANRVISVQGLAFNEALNQAVLSPDGSKMAIQIYKDNGNDAAVINTDGSGLTSVSGNDAARWDGSGYQVGAFSPDGQSILIYNGFSPADRSTEIPNEYEIHNLDGKRLSIMRMQGYTVVYSTSPCWYDESHIYAIFSKDAASTSFLAVYDKDSNKVTRLSNLEDPQDARLSCSIS